MAGAGTFGRPPASGATLASSTRKMVRGDGSTSRGAITGSRSTVASETTHTHDWRDQMEQIALGLRGYALEHEGFREQLERYGLGAVVGAELSEDVDCLNLTLAFDLTDKERFHTTTNVVYTTRGSTAQHLEQVTGRAQTDHGRATHVPTALAQEQLRVKTGGRGTTGTERLHKGAYSVMESRLLAVEVGGDGEGRVSVVKELLKKGADPNYVDPKTQEPLLALAATHGHPKCITALARAGADANQPISRTAGVPLHRAVTAADATLARASVEALLAVRSQAMRN